jgi:small subunit ribosomal protein S2
LPDAIIITGDISIHRTAIQEANKMKIPVIAICDTNSNPNGIDFPIPGNDDAIKSVHLIILSLLSVFRPNLVDRIDEILTKKIEKKETEDSNNEDPSSLEQNKVPDLTSEQ